MTPIDFVVHKGGSSPNQGVLYVAEAMREDVVITAEDGEYEVLSYYMANGRMCLDIQRKRKKQ